MKTKPETSLSKAIQDALKAMGVWTIRINSGGRSGRVRLAPAGTPDLYAIGYGFIEIKRPGQRLTPEQVNWHARAREHGERVAVVHSVGEAWLLVSDWQTEREHAKAMGWDT